MPPDAQSSGRLAGIVLAEDHLVGKRIVDAAMTISARLAGDPVAVLADQRLLWAMGLLVWLTKNFIDPFPHRKVEEVLIPFA